MAVKYYAKLDATKHVETIYLEGQLKDTSGLTLVQVPDLWFESFVKDWTDFYIQDDGSLNFDSNKATKTQQQIDDLQNTVNQLLMDSTKGAE